MREAVARFLTGPWDALKPLAQCFHALPVYADIGGALLIRQDGEVLVVHSNQSWEPKSEREIEAEIVKDAKWVQPAYECCWKDHPELRPVLYAMGFSQ